MHPPIRTGIIGFGMAGKVFHAPFIHTLPGFQLRKISTSKVATARETRAIYPDTAVVEDARSILEDPDIDLVIICTPNTEHFPLAQDALLRGKHVIVEKPFTVTSVEADTLVALARQQKRILSIHHNRRWAADYKTVQKVIASQLLGSLATYEARYDRFRPALRPQAWREEMTPGAGILYDLGAHLIDQVLQLFGQPGEITADVQIQRPGGRADDYFDLVLQYPGLRVSLHAGMLVKKPGPFFCLHGDCGSFIKSGMDVQEEALKAGGTPANTRDWGLEPEHLWGQLFAEYKGLQINGIIPSERGSFQDFFINVQQAIWGESALLVTPEQARDTIRIIELALQSSREKRTLTCR
ncbi:MAG: oxidoreductase [Lewinellaceae bacterium]|nr:oxidoreductase [Lewinellaceae bacterium]